MERYDAIVIGSGQAGTPLAVAMADSGRKTILIESRHVGGTCVNEGCTPTKTMVASARVAYLGRRGSDYGVCGCDVVMDLERVRERKRAIVESFRTGNESRIQKTPGLELLRAAARFIGPKTVEVELSGGIRRLTAELIFINTGTRATRPQLDGLAAVPALDNASIMELSALPDHLIILGGGYIGVEFGQMFRRFGSRVTIVHSHSRLLSREDEDVAEEIGKILSEDGIELLLDSRARRVSRDGDASTADIGVKAGARTV
ncbi:MAG: FAD-dependent oxidoreductase, partial [Acidobacteria bacterium]|nr:FAD-dependent oxidoreductase [Acidobacteriota bacterium]